MTKNSIKVALFASLTVAMIIPLASFNFVTADDADNTGNVIIKTERVENKVMDDALAELVKLDEQLEKSSSISQKDEILQKMQKVKQDALSELPAISEAKREEYRSEATKLADKLFDEDIAHGDRRIVPYTTIGYSSAVDAILIGIESGYVTPENMETYAVFIQSVVPNHIKVVLHPGGIWMS